MRKLIVWASVTVSVVAGIAGGAPAAYAKHHKLKDAQTSAATAAVTPCSTLTSNIQKRIGDFNALKKTIAAEKDQPPKTLMAVLDRLDGKAGADTTNLQKLADQRRQIEQLNTMLELSSCKPVDIAHELAGP